MSCDFCVALPCGTMGLSAVREFNTQYFDKKPGLVWILTVQYVNTCEINGLNNNAWFRCLIAITF